MGRRDLLAEGEVAPNGAYDVDVRATKGPRSMDVKGIVRPGRCD
ncbi:hypothetical protein WMF39_22325 [Sorangium sp. So ce1504]